ncbi:MAG: hypothetical protein LBM20_02275 [Rikenellaceae bacterium]|jgi:hypothetical protein|nr:hypothetical protein [Rikenellaceae bacterium]
MIESIITDYLRHNRRLVIPGLGAFLTKEGGETVFVPFLNKDDGQLTALVRQAFGASTAEAEEIISRYVENVREGIAGYGAFLVAPLGSLKRDANGILFLDRSDRTARPEIAVAPAPAPAPAPIVEEKIEEKEEETVPPKHIAEPTPIVPLKTVAERVSPEEFDDFEEEEIEPEPVQAPAPVKTVAESVEAPKTLNDLIREKQAQRQARPTLNERMAEAAKEPEPPKPQTSAPVPRPVQAQPLPERKTASDAPAKTAKDASVPASAPRPSSVLRSSSAKTPPSTPTPKKRGDNWLLIGAILVAVVAVAAMIYAYAVVELPVFNLQ